MPSGTYLHCCSLMHQQWHTVTLVNSTNCNVSIFTMEYKLRDDSLWLVMYLSRSFIRLILKFLAFLGAIRQLTTGKSLQNYTVKLLIDEPCKWPQAFNWEFKIHQNTIKCYKKMIISFPFSPKLTTKKMCEFYSQTRAKFIQLIAFNVIINFPCDMVDIEQLVFMTMKPKIHSLKIIIVSILVVSGVW